MKDRNLGCVGVQVGPVSTVVALQLSRHLFALLVVLVPGRERHDALPLDAVRLAPMASDWLVRLIV